MINHGVKFSNNLRNPCILEPSIVGMSDIGKISRRLLVNSMYR